MQHKINLINHRSVQSNPIKYSQIHPNYNPIQLISVHSNLLNFAIFFSLVEQISMKL